MCVARAIAAARSLGVPDAENFQTDDLFSSRALRQPRLCCRGAGGGSSDMRTGAARGGKTGRKRQAGHHLPAVARTARAPRGGLRGATTGRERHAARWRQPEIKVRPPVARFRVLRCASADPGAALCPLISPLFPARAFARTRAAATAAVDSRS